MNLIIAAVISGVIGAAIGLLIARAKKFSAEDAFVKSETLIRAAEKEISELKESSSRALKEYQKKAEEDYTYFEGTVRKFEATLNAKEQLVQKKEQRILDHQKSYAAGKEKTSGIAGEMQNLRREQISTLTVRAGASEEALKKNIVEQYTYALQEEEPARLQRFEDFVRENAEREAKEILVNSMQRMGTILTQDEYTEKVEIPKGNDFVKAQLVGSGGVHIRLFEEMLDVTVIFNDFPNTISIACYNLVNRHIARLAYEKLVQMKGNFTEDTIKKAVEAAQKDVDKELYTIGLYAIKKLPEKKNFQWDPELIRIVGRLAFRTSYGQNIMRHSLEVGYVARTMADELNAQTEIAWIGGFLHDLGKAIDQNPDIIGAHDYLTKELMEKYGFSWEETHAAWTHHEAEKPSTVEAMLVKGADAVSAGRPGARQESLEKYVERIRLQESIAGSYDGVQKAYAISAGREIRILVDPVKMLDERLLPLAAEIASRYEKEVAYPGTIKVNVIRKTRAAESARGIRSRIPQG